MNNKSNDVNGKHYASLGISPFEYSFANKLDCYQHTAIKYITRHADKGGIADIDKAIKTLELYKEALDNTQTTCDDKPAEIEALNNLINSVKGIYKNRGIEITHVFSIGRGGAWAAAQIAYALDVQCDIVDSLDLFDDAGASLGEGSLFVDDICDTGETIYKVKKEYPEVLTAVLFNRADDYVKVKKAARPDYFGSMIWHNEYVEMPISQYADANNNK